MLRFLSDIKGNCKISSNNCHVEAFLVPVQITPLLWLLRGHICQFVRIRDVPNLGDKQQHEVCTKLGDKDLKLFQNFKYWVYPGLEIV